MFKNTKAFGGFSVDDLGKAKHFYADILKLDVLEIPMGPGILEIHLGGGGKMILYPKPNHEPASFTVLNFPVPNVEKAVADLKALGIKFESYDWEQLKTDEDQIFRGGGPLIAWFKDPAGNILSVLEEKE